MEIKPQEINDVEMWENVPNSNGLYMISNHGNVIRLERVIYRRKYKFTSPEKRIRPTSSGKGYPSFCINKTGHKSYRVYVHRLVALFFVENPHNLTQVNHEDGNKLNNHHSNLKWCSVKENINHAFKTGLNKHVVKNDIIRSKPVIQLSKDMKPVAEFPSVMEVQRTLGFRSPNINQAIHQNKMSNGYYWQYKSN